MIIREITPIYCTAVVFSFGFSKTLLIGKVLPLQVVCTKTVMGAFARFVLTIISGSK